MPVQAVAIVVYEGVQALDVAGPMDVFSEANTFLGSADRYETVLVAAHRNPLRASNGIRLVADLTFEEAAGGFDIILVAGGSMLWMLSAVALKDRLPKSWPSCKWASCSWHARRLRHPHCATSNEVVT